MHVDRNILRCPVEKTHKWVLFLKKRRKYECLLLTDKHGPFQRLCNLQVVYTHFKHLMKIASTDHLGNARFHQGTELSTFSDAFSTCRDDFSPLLQSFTSVFFLPEMQRIITSLIYIFITQLLPTGFFILFCFLSSRNLASLPWENRTKLTNTVFFLCCL